MPQKNIIISKEEFSEIKEQLKVAARNHRGSTGKPLSLRKFIDQFMPDIENMIESGMNFRQIHEILNRLLEKHDLTIGLSTLNVYYRKFQESKSDSKIEKRQVSPPKNIEQVNLPPQSSLSLLPLSQPKTNQINQISNQVTNNRKNTKRPKIDLFKTTNPDDL